MDIEYPCPPLPPEGIDENGDKAWNMRLPPIAFPDRLAVNWLPDERPADWIDWEKFADDRGALWWQVVELSLGISPMVRSRLDLKVSAIGMTTGTVYDMGFPNPLRNRIAIIQQYKDKLASMPKLEPYRIGSASDPYLPGKSGPDWAIEWGRFREFADSRGWTIPDGFPVDRPFFPSVSSRNAGEDLADLVESTKPKRWGVADEKRLAVVKKAGLVDWILGELKKGTKKGAIVVDLLKRLGEPEHPNPDKSPWSRVVQYLTPEELAKASRRRGGPGN